MKNRSLLVKKLNLFYKDIKNKRAGQMRLQTDLNNDFNVDMFYTRVQGGKAFAAEQKIRKFN